MPLVVPVITILMLLMIAPCIINCLTCFIYAQVSKLQHAVPVQQGYRKLQLTTENITHPQVDTTIRALRLETSKRGNAPLGMPNAPCHSSSGGSIQRDLNAPSPKELGLPSLERGMLGSQNTKKKSRMVVARRQGREQPVKIEQRKVLGPE